MATANSQQLEEFLANVEEFLANVEYRELRGRWKNMTPEQRQKASKKWKNQARMRQLEKARELRRIEQNRYRQRF